MKRNALNTPIVVLGIATTISSMSMTQGISLSGLEGKYVIDTSSSITNNFGYQKESVVKKVTLEEDTQVKSFNMSMGNDYSILNNENEKYIIKNNLEKYISDMEEMFGGMRYLTEEGQKDYDDNLDELYQDAGVQLFDFI